MFVLFSLGCTAERAETATSNASMTAIEAEPSPETFALGTEVTATGAVPQQAAAENFVRGGEVYLSVDVSGASSEQMIEVKWVDPDGKVLRHDRRRAPQGSQHVPFSSGTTHQWPRGDHRAVILIDGRTVSEKSFALL